jgi:hypothetical protein
MIVVQRVGGVRSRQKPTDSEADEKSCLRLPKNPQECNA